MHHGVRIQDAALVAAAVLSDRYVTGRFLPDKAIDLIDEAAQPPAHRDRLDADRDRRRRPAASASSRSSGWRSQKETDAASVERLARLEEELANLREQQTAMTAHWQAREGRDRRDPRR